MEQWPGHAGPMRTYGCLQILVPSSPLLADWLHKRVGQNHAAKECIKLRGVNISAFRTKHPKNIPKTS